MTGPADRVILLKRRRPGSPDAGQWAVDEKTRRPKDVVIGCPNCGAELWLKTYKIDRHGDVTPALVDVCGFHEWISLGEWSPPRRPGPRFRNEYDDA